MHKILFYNKFIICLYMFRARFTNHQSVKILLYSVWYHQNSRWPTGAQVERGIESSLNLCTGQPHPGVIIPNTVQYILDLQMMSTQ